MISSMELLTYLLGVVVVCCTSFYLFLRKRYKYWEDLGVPGPKPEFLFGNMRRLVKLELTEAELISTFYNEFPNEKFIGIYNLWKPTLLIRDLELIRVVCIRNFEHFTDHPNVSSGDGTDHVAGGLFFMKGKLWRSRRQTLSKTLTPRRLKGYSEDLNARLDGLLQDIRKTEGQDVNLIHFLDRTTAKFLLAAFYGLDLTHNDEMLDKLLELNDLFFYPPAFSVLKALFYDACPAVYKFLGMRTFPPKIWEFYHRVASDIIASRKVEDKRNDFITLLMNHMGEDFPENEKIDFTEAVSHVFNWFLASHHTTMLNLGHVLLRLSRHPEIQEKVLEEVGKVDSKLLDYKDLGKMVYFDAVIQESQRMESIVGVQKRICNKEYPLNENFKIPVGMEIYFPVSSLHKDPAYFPEPEVFRPERFIEDPSNEAFMAFGKGPRICVGARFAEVMTKLVLGTVLREFSVEPSSKMKFPMVFDAKSLFISNSPIDGIWVKFRPRKPPS